ncbi:MAG: hypothetical protein ACJASQ_003078 [Crocinitomicaceae bacterium]|jgi:hypothetical protein
MDHIDFSKTYTLIGDSQEFHEEWNTAKRCTFCTKMEPDVKFKNTAHLIPELLGANKFTYQNECDSCNATFSKFENDLAKFFRPYLVLTSTRGKKKIAKFKSREDDQSTCSQVISKGGSSIQMVFDENLTDFDIDRKNKRMRVTFRKIPFRPLFVYKALARIGMSMLPESERASYGHVFDWIRKEDGSLIEFHSFVHFKVLSKAKFEFPFAKLYKANMVIRDNEEYPDYLLVVCFANVVVQLFLPFSKIFDHYHDKKRNLALEIFPLVASGFSADVNSPRVKCFDVSSYKHVNNNETLWFDFDVIT